MNFQLADQGCLCQLKEMLPMIFEWIEMVKAVLSRHVFIQDKISGLFCSKNQNSNGDNSLSCTSWSGFPDGIDPGKLVFSLMTRKIVEDFKCLELNFS